jgi:hypothetical protein
MYEILEIYRNAISSLQKLSNGDSNSPSHSWELFNLNLPAMTLKQRIDVLKERYYSFKTVKISNLNI